MNPLLQTQFAPPDPNAAPLTVAQMVELLNALVQTTFVQPNSYIPYVVGSNQPGADDQDKAWLQLDASGRPLAIKTFYNGHWRRVYNGMLGEVRGYSGDPTQDFDTTGLGKIGMTYDGWHLCNGRDGTPDLSDRFLIAAHMNNNSVAGYQNGQWVTTEVHSAGEATGGTREITLGPATTYIPESGTLTTSRLNVSGVTFDANGPILGAPIGGPDNTTLPIVNIPGNTTPEAINIINPFIALAYIIFVGYN